MLYAPGIASIKFSPIELQLDNIIYEVPFDRWFDVWQDDLIAMRNITLSDKMTLGMSFLNTFYQVYDMQRNQLALVPNSNNSELNPPRVLVRNSFSIIMSCSTTLFLCLLAYAAFNSVVGHENTPY